MSTSICWFRRDLRLADNTALSAAIAASDAVVPCFVVPGPGPHAPGQASRAYMNHSLASLDVSLRERGNALTVRVGDAPAALVQLVRETGATAVHCQRVWTPQDRAQEDAVAASLREAGCELVVHEGSLLVTPDALHTAVGGPFRVFTPFHRAWERVIEPDPLPAPATVPSPTIHPASSGPVSTLPGGPDVTRWWQPGEAAAQARLREFVRGPLGDYTRDHDRPDVHGTSELSMRLAWGELSPAQAVVAAGPVGSEEAAPWVRQLAWREFAHHVLHHFPYTLDEPLRPEFRAFPWSDDAASVEAWKRGRTGYAFVDAGMRQLASTGWMHNRARMVCASFLVKDLLVDWRVGEAHFRERLIDYDPALNVFNWQWVAGCGADAAPYFRIFNPVIQARKFDPHGAYAAQWAPDSATIAPLIDHAEARDRALAAFRATRDAAPPPG